MLGWTSGSGDGLNILTNIAGCRDANGKGGTFNYGGYCNPKVEALAKLIQVEIDIKKRDDLMMEAFQIIHDEVGLLPLHQQSLAWGVSKKIKIEQRADNQILFHNVTKE
jgi:peptide/nickel transport system substrate-binding protein